jgi:hypothetical protein
MRLDNSDIDAEGEEVVVVVSPSQQLQLESSDCVWRIGEGDGEIRHDTASLSLPNFHSPLSLFETQHSVLHLHAQVRDLLQLLGEHPFDEMVPRCSGALGELAAAIVELLSTIPTDHTRPVSMNG